MKTWLAWQEEDTHTHTHKRTCIRKMITRRRAFCTQVSPAGLATMLTYYANVDASTSAMGAVSSSMMLTRDDMTRCKQEAVKAVSVPPHVIQMVTDLRTYLQVRAAVQWGVWMPV